MGERSEPQNSSTSCLFAQYLLPTLVLLVGQFNCVRLLFVEREIRAPNPRNCHSLAQSRLTNELLSRPSSEKMRTLLAQVEFS